MQTKGYKIIFSSNMSNQEIEKHIDDLLREVDARRQIAQVIEMSSQEIYEELKKLD